MIRKRRRSRMPIHETVAPNRRRKNYNTVGVAPIVNDKNRWEFYDKLPAKIRMALRNAVINVSARGVYEHWRAAGESAVLRGLEEYELQEIMGYSGQHEGKFGKPTPHVSAFASVLRAEKWH